MKTRQAHCLLLLRSIHGEGEQRQPSAHQVGVSVGILLSLTCLALLIFYIHHITKSIKSNHILAGISKEAIHSLDDIRSDLGIHDFTGFCETIKPNPLKLEAIQSYLDQCLLAYISSLSEF